MPESGEKAAHADRIVVVDHKETQRDAIARALRKFGYEVITTDSGEHALDLFRSVTPAIMLCNVAMPGMSGLDLLEALPETLGPDANVAVVMFSGVADADTAAACVQRGAVDYLTKPFTVHDLGDAMTRALKVRAAREREVEVSGQPSAGVGEGQRESQKPVGRRERVVLPTLDALVAALEAKNPYLAGHSARVSAFAATIAHHLSLDDDIVEEVRIAGRLHDLGMIGVRDQVIDKRGKLTPEEHAHVREHVGIGVRILAPLTYLGPAMVDNVRTHHERWDGGGYPEGLTGEEIPLGGRIICACEIFDALTTRRPYRDLVGPEPAIERMRELAGNVVDPTVVDALTSAVQQRQALTFLQ
jgi:response regulator RpfG family c-di-GMP phosphodiesterase